MGIRLVPASGIPDFTTAAASPIGRFMSGLTRRHEIGRAAGRTDGRHARRFR